MPDIASIHAALLPVQTLISSGKKLHAIKALRSISGLGLKDAKDAVEHFAANGVWRPADIDVVQFFRARTAPPLRVPAAQETEETLTAPPPQADPLLAIRVLLDKGRKIEAIKLYREHHGVGLKDAKDAIETYQTTSQWPTSASVPCETANTSPLAASVMGGTPLTLGGSYGLARSPGAGESEQARAALTKALGQGAQANVELPAECGLYKGYLFVTDNHVAFAANRYGSWELTETLARAELDRVETSDGPFGAELTLRAGFHTARFAELSQPEATDLRDYLLGKKSEPPRAAVISQQQPSPARSTGLLPSEFDYVKETPLSAGSPAIGSASTVGAIPFALSAKPAKRFSLLKVIFSAFVAAAPAFLVGSLWRWVPMAEFPRVAFDVLLFSAIGLGGALRGRAGLMLQAGFVAGIAHWAISIGVYQPIVANLASLVILAAASAKAWGGNWALGALLALPITAVNAVLTLPTSVIGTTVPTLPLAFWFVAFLAEDAVRARKPVAG